MRICLPRIPCPTLLFAGAYANGRTSAQSKSSDSNRRVPTTDDVETSPVKRRIHINPFCTGANGDSPRCGIELRVVELRQGNVYSVCGGEPYIRRVSPAFDRKRRLRLADGFQLPAKVR